MTGPDRQPPTELGRAFADLVENPPPSRLTPAQIIGAADEGRTRRMRWVVGSGVAAGVIALATIVGVSVNTSGSTTSGAASAAGSSAPASPTSAAVPAPPAPSAPAPSATAPSRSSSAAGAAPQQGAGSAEPDQSSSCPAGITLSAQQRASIGQALPDLGTVEAVGCSGAAGSSYLARIGDGVGMLEVHVRPGSAAPCPSPAEEGVTCEPVQGYDGYTARSATAAAPGTNRLEVQGGTGKNISIVVDLAEPAAGSPYSPEQLAALIQQLLGTF